MNHTTLADEDFAIRRDRLPSELDAVIAECDAADYRAMLALTKWLARWPGYPHLPARMERWAATREPRSKGYDYILSQC